MKKQQTMQISYCILLPDRVDWTSLSWIFAKTLHIQPVSCFLLNRNMLISMRIAMYATNTIALMVGSG